MGGGGGGKINIKRKPQASHVFILHALKSFPHFRALGLFRIIQINQFACGQVSFSLSSVFSIFELFSIL